MLSTMAVIFLLFDTPTPRLLAVQILPLPILCCRYLELFPAGWADCFNPCPGNVIRFRFGHNPSPPDAFLTTIPCIIPRLSLPVLALPDTLASHRRTSWLLLLDGAEFRWWNHVSTLQVYKISRIPRDTHITYSNLTKVLSP